MKPAVIIELKVAKKFREMEAKAEEALVQIKERQYDAWLPEEGYTQCYHVGIGFYKKRCRVKMDKVELPEL